MSTVSMIKNNSINEATAFDNESLNEVMQNIDKAWGVIETISTADAFYPTILKENKAYPRTDVSTMKANLARRKQLIGWIDNESDIDAASEYYALYCEELALLDAYALATIVRLYKDDQTILNYVSSAQQEAKEAKEAKRRETVQKAIAKRKETIATRKREAEEAKRDQELLKALIANGFVDEDILSEIKCAA